jgi:uncharacterized repeat protein (TIGR02543 family)
MARTACHARKGGRYRPTKRTRTARLATLTFAVALPVGTVLAVTPDQVASAPTGITYYVNSATDTGASDCAASSNTDCGIDDAIGSFNADTTANDADTIELSSSITTFTSTDDTDIDNSTSGVTLTIDGNGPSTTAVSGDKTNGVFTVEGPQTVTFSGLTIEDGSALYGAGIYANYCYCSIDITDSGILGNAAAYYGGGIYGTGVTLDVTDSSYMFGNTANYDGGGIYVEDGSMDVTYSDISNNTAGVASGGTGGGGIWDEDSGTDYVSHSVISGNTADYYGGGIVNESTMDVSDSVISGNTANYGGGIYGLGGTLDVTDSVISGNTADYDGGGIGNGSTMDVSDSTISGNTAESDGGGIWDEDSGTDYVTDSTISGNTADSDGGGIANRSTMDVSDGTISGNTAESDGGGIYNDSTMYLAGNILANSSSSGGECAGVGNPITDDGYNIDDDGSCGFTGTGSVSDSSTLDTYLGPLQNNGGPTDTIALLAGSPAIGIVPNPTFFGPIELCPRFDQRGVSSSSGMACDVGAYQTQISNYTVTYNGNGSTSGDPPTDQDSPYSPGATVTVLGNVGSPPLANTGYSFGGWNTESDGDGGTYAAGSTFTMPASDVTLYAIWTKNTLPEKTTTGLSLSKTSVTYGAETNETVTVTVTGQSGDGYPDGTVTIYNSSTPLCSPSLAEKNTDSSTATCSLSATELPVGSYRDVFATYVPGTPSSSNTSYAYTASSSPPAKNLSVTKDTTTTKVSESPTTVTYGDESAVVFTVTVTTTNGEAVPNGEKVTVTIGSATCTVTLNADTGTCTISNSTLKPGKYSVSATYRGDPNLRGSSGTSATRLTVR